MTLKMFSLGLSCLIALWAYQQSYKPESSKAFLGTRLTLLLMLILYNAVYYVISYFTGVGINDAAMFHIKYGLQGSGYREYLDLIIGTLVSICAIMAVALHTDIRQRRRTAHQSSNKRPLKPHAVIGLFLVSFLFSPTSWDIARYNLEYRSAEQQTSKIPLADHYKRDAVEVAPGADQRNLLVIYLESFERTYFNEEIFPDLLNGLPELEKQATTFTNIKQLPGTGWTIAGNVASQCGIPLVTPSHGNSMRNAFQFLPRAKCLGDYLSEAGYDLSLVMGTPKEFAGTAGFAQAHGFSTIIDAESIANMETLDPVERTYWGVSDSTLLKVTKKELVKLHDKPGPFALFVATMDTHPPKGHASQSCTGKEHGDGSNPMLNSVKCSDDRIAGFVEELLETDYADDLVIVLVSDHLAMQNTASDVLKSAPDRKNLFMVIDPRSKNGAQNNRHGSTLDVGATILPFLGFTGPIGLGRDLSKENSLSDQFENFGEQLTLWNSDFMEMWDFPQIDYWTPIEIVTNSKEVRIGNQALGFPLLLQADRNGKTNIYFNTDSIPDHRSLTSHFLSLPSESGFIWVDQCSVLAGPSFDADHFCTIYGHSTDKAHGPAPLNDGLTILGSQLLSTAVSFQEPSEREIAKRATDTSRFIAHAGGSIGDFTYTNSLEALTNSYRLGFRFFELDIIETLDGQYVAAHDWQHWKEITNAAMPSPPTREEFLQKLIHGRFTPLDMDRINKWFARHPDAVLVTDKVDDPIGFASRFVAPDRLIMELFSEEALVKAAQSNLVTPMANFSLLRNGLAPERLRELGVYHIAASRREIRSNLPLFEKLNKLGFKVFLYHANFDTGKDEKFMVCHDMNFAYGIYADQYDFSQKVTC